ncbi:MAG: hydroxylamine reductase [Methylococcales bacterium]|nr:hydroxylamine reductase [Methylococcales bacterium]
MFCYHCQEAKKNLVCDKTGICGKKENISSLQDLLMFSLKGLAFYSIKADEFDLLTLKTHRFIAKALFSMVTNVNFSPADFVDLIDEAIRRRNTLREQFLQAYQQHNEQAFLADLPEEAEWQYDAIDETVFTDKGATIGVEKDSETLDEDVHALQECLLYAVKGLGSLAVHNLAVANEETTQYQFIQQALNFTLNKDNTLDQVLAMNLRSGELGLAAMQKLEQANCKQFGHPEPTTVHLDTWDNPGILVTGHDLQDIEDLLEQTAETGVDVYTHGEAISAHAYPALKKYFNLVANYGGAWQSQKTEFPKFNGPVLITTNSIQQPKKTYQDKLFSTGMVGWPNVPHIADRKPEQRKDFSTIINCALNSDAPTPLTEGQVVTGFGTKTLNELLSKISAAIKANKIKRIIVIAGTDGRHKERRYYTELAESLADDILIMTAGDIKFRFHQHDFAQIDGIPRFFDVGQSNDFSIIIGFLQDLQSNLGLNALNDLPVSFQIAWYEQKTILMMLSLFALGFKNIRVGPTLPPFFTPNILTLLAEKFALKGIDSVENDIEMMLNGEIEPKKEELASEPNE